MSKIKLSDHFTFRRILLAVLPSITMMVFSSIYSIADGLFIAEFVGADAFSGINLAWPFIAILWAIGFMMGSGGSALVGKTLGEGDSKKANEIFSLVIYSTAVLSTLVSLVGYFAMEPLIRWMASLSNDNTEGMVQNALTYGHILAIFLPFAMLQNVFQSFFVTAEKPITGFLFILFGGLTNIILDAVFIAGLHWGIEGAACGTIIGQVVAGIGPIFYFLVRKDLRLRLGKTHFDFKVLAKTCTNGISEFVSSIAGSIVGVCYNAQLLAYIGPKGVSAYGVIMYMAYVFSAIFMGYSIGISPIVSYHYGAENKKELHGLLVKSLIIIAIASLAMFGLSQGIGPLFARAFCEGDAELLQITNVSIRIYSFVFLVCGFSIFGSGFFTALNNGLISAIISLVRALVFELIFVWTFPLIWGVTGIWVSAPCAEIASAILTSCCFLIGWKKYGY